MRYALYIDVPRDNKTQSKKDRLLWQPLLWTIIPLRNCFPEESLPIHKLCKDSICFYPIIFQLKKAYCISNILVFQSQNRFTLI